jgi:hypothetical protein
LVPRDGKILEEEDAPKPDQGLYDAVNDETNSPFG